MNNRLPTLWIAEILGRLLTIAAAIYSARIVGIETYGLVGYIAAVTMYFSVIVQFGTDFIIVRELSKNNLSSNEKDAFRAVAISLRLLLILCAAAIIIGISNAEESVLSSRLYLASAASLLSLLVPMESFFQSEQQYGYIAKSKIFVNSLNLVIIYFCLTHPSAAWWIPLASTISMIVTQLLFLRYVRGNITVPQYSQWQRMTMHLIKESTPLLFSMLLLLMVGQFGIIVVKTFSSANELGLYVAGYKIYDIVNAMLGPVAIIAFPELSKIWELNSIEKRTLTLITVIRITFSVALLAVGISVLAGDVLMAIVFGEQFRYASVYSSILLMTVVFRSISMFFALSLVASGRQKKHLLVTLCMVIINVFIAYLSIQQYGAIGAAWSNVFAFGMELVGFTLVLNNTISVKMICFGIVDILLWWCIAIFSGWMLNTAFASIQLAPVIGSLLFVSIFGGLMYFSKNRSMNTM